MFNVVDHGAGGLVSLIGLKGWIFQKFEKNNS